MLQFQIGGHALLGFGREEDLIGSAAQLIYSSYVFVLSIHLSNPLNIFSTYLLLGLQVLLLADLRLDIHLVLHPLHLHHVGVLLLL